ncbi:MAG: FadR/GntR family transcriptional regulator [Acidimicrobiia bacterium]
MRTGARSRPNDSKLAAVVAGRIVGDIAELGWPVGQVVGSEADLLARYGVSRAVFREGVRLVEHQQVASMRRGPGGGLVVAAPGVGSVTDAVCIYLFYVGAEIEEVFEARLALEVAAAELAPKQLEEANIESLRALVQRERDGKIEDHRELHALVASISGNPALEFFVDLLNRVTMLYFPRTAGLTSKTLNESAKAHAAIADAILAGNEGLASNRMRKHLQAEAEFLRDRRPSRRRLADLRDVVGRSDKRGEETARQILLEVAAAGWPVGTLLGSEAELMDRYDISRAVLREAVRVLEHHQVARMRRGPGGGLFVAEPGVDATTDAVALNVERRGIRPEQLFEVRGAVEMAVLDRVMAHLDEAGIVRLGEALETEQGTSREDFGIVGHDLHGVLVGVAGNRVLELLTLVLLRLTRHHQATPESAPNPRTDPLPSQDVIRAHRAIVAAILARDLELARHRMRRHLDALRHWVR